MKFWLFMLCFCLLIPIVMVVFGALFLKRAPKQINFIFGYRTAGSMRSKETWNFAHRFFGKIWMILGVVLFVLSVAVMLIFLKGDKNTVGTVGTVIAFIQMVCLTVPIIPTEIALKKKFSTVQEKEQDITN